MRARVLYERALTIRRRAFGAEHPDVAWSLGNLARIDADLGNLLVARREVNDAITMYRRFDVSDEPDHVARVLLLRGEIEAREGDERSARARSASNGGKFSSSSASSSGVRFPRPTSSM